MLLLWSKWKAFLVVVEQAAGFQQSFLTSMPANPLTTNVGMHVQKLGTRVTAKKDFMDAACFPAGRRAVWGVSFVRRGGRSTLCLQNPDLFCSVSVAGTSFRKGQRVRAEAVVIMLDSFLTTTKSLEGWPSINCMSWWRGTKTVKGFSKANKMAGGTFWLFSPLWGFVLAFYSRQMKGH